MVWRCSLRPLRDVKYMSLKWVKKTEEHKRKLSIKAKERMADPENRKRISIKLKWRIFSQETIEKRRKTITWVKRWPHTEETKRKISEANKWKKPSEETRKKLSESHKWKFLEKSSNWKWWVSKTRSERSFAMSRSEYKQWRKWVLAKDWYKCVKCWKSWKWLNCHHIENFSENELLRYDVLNWITLCKKHHKLFHHIFWYKNNNLEQILEFLDSK